MPALKIDIKLQSAIDHQFLALPTLQNLVNFGISKEEPVSSFCFEVIKKFRTPESEKEVNRILKPIIRKYNSLGPLTNDSLPALLTVKQQETGIISFLMNNLLHTAIPYWVKRRAKVHRQHLFQIEENGSQIASIGSSQRKRLPIPAITSKIFSCKKNVYFSY